MTPGGSLSRGDGCCATEGDNDCDGGRCGKAGAASSASSSDASGVYCWRGAAGAAIDLAAVGEIGAPPPRILASEAAGPWVDVVGELGAGEASESDATAFLFDGDLTGEVSCNSI